ncbi:MAG TPA: hypothetical protein VHQ87_06675, partial [Rhizobacter sp.]|nr:hypothetical protein [Rhizobacter sp.]
FACCEGNDGADPALQASLTVATSYAGAAQRKVFLAERIASFLLCTEPHWRSHAANPFGFAWSTSRFRDHPVEAFISDALKTAYRDRPFPEYLQAFARIRQTFSGNPLLQPNR